MGEDVAVAVAVGVPAQIIWDVVSADDRMGEWSGEWRKHDSRWSAYNARWTSRNRVLERHQGEAGFSLRWRTGNWLAYWGCREWQLDLAPNPNGTGTITEKFIGPRTGPADLIRADLDRLQRILEPPQKKEFTQPADLLTLLTVYTTQFGSFTTMLWQVPALGLTAQAFLMTIALGSGNSGVARLAASVLSVIIAGASQSLMHSQRGRAINQAELAKRVSAKLAVDQLLGGDFALNDAVPKRTNAVDIWDADHQIYAIWKVCMLVFILVDLVVILSVLTRWRAF